MNPSFITLPSGILLNLQHLICLTLTQQVPERGRNLLATLSHGQTLSLPLGGPDATTLLRGMAQHSADVSPFLAATPQPNQHAATP